MRVLRVQGINVDVIELRLFTHTACTQQLARENDIDLTNVQILYPNFNRTENELGDYMAFYGEGEEVVFFKPKHDFGV